MRHILAATLLCLPLCGCMMPDHAKQTAANEVFLKQEGITALESGQPAPSLATAVDAVTGQPGDLAALLEGKAKGVIVFFVPAVDTPNTLTHLRQWQKWAGDLAGKGLGVVAVAPGSADEVKQWAAANGLLLPMLADPGSATAKAWGCLASEGSFPQRTAIGVGPDDGVVWFYRGMPPMTEIEKAFNLNQK